ncbi:MAG: hypothetical protein GWQ08_01950 [Verrucomicrobiaceae bacterium]|nr:hypothetical protein [Verrucomicrobiaceae bacterium]
MRLHPQIVIGLLVLTAHFASAQSGLDCAAAQRTLEQTIREYPEKAVVTLTEALRGNLSCAGLLTESAITASDASDELVAKLVAAALRAAPGKAVVIAESAIAASPSASDEVADVVQTVLGDCGSIAEDVSIAISRDKGRLIVVLEDAMRSHGNCACEVVTAAVKAAGGSDTVIAQIVETSVKLKPTMAADISECASAAAPRQLAAVQRGLDRALTGASRGPGALPAAAEVNDTEPVAEERGITLGANPGEEVRSPQGAVPETTYQSLEAPAERQSHGENVNSGYGKNSKQGEGDPKPEVEEKPKADDWGWDWISWGSNGGAPVYLIAPSGGVIPPGELVPISPSDSKIDDKKQDETDYKKDD